LSGEGSLEFGHSIVEGGQRIIEIFGDCIEAASKLEDKLGEVATENRLSTMMADLKESVEGLKAAVGNEFLPGAKDSAQALTLIVDGLKEGIQDIENFANSTAGQALLRSIPGSSLVGAAGAAVSGAAAASQFTPEAMERQRKRSDAELAEEERQTNVNQSRENARLFAQQEAERRLAERTAEEDRRNNEKINREHDSEVEAEAKREIQLENQIERQIAGIDRQDANAEQQRSRREQMEDLRRNQPELERGFQSQTIAFDQIYSRIAAAAASSKDDPAQQAKEQREKLWQEQKKLQEDWYDDAKGQRAKERADLVEKLKGIGALT